MRLAELYARVVNAPDEPLLVGIATISALAILISGIFWLIRRMEVAGRILGILGVVGLVASTFLAHEQTVEENPSPAVHITRPRYSDEARLGLRALMVGVPTCAVLVMGMGLSLSRRRLRSTVPGHIRSGIKFFYHKDYEAAIGEYDVAIGIAPDRGEAYFHRGCAQEILGRQEAALADFDRAIRFDPQIFSAYINRGRLRTAMGRYQEAFDDFERALSLRPNNPQIFLERGIYHAKQGQRAQAMADLEKVLRITNDINIAEPARNALRELGVLENHIPAQLGNEPRQD